MNFDLKLGKAAAVLFLALAMAGCGGGGTTTPEPEPPPPAPIDVERMTISDAIAAASAAAGMVTDASTDAEVMAADMAVAAAMAAINGATLITAGEAATNRASLATIAGQLDMAKASRTMAMTLASERMAISDAIAAAMTAVGAVMDDSDAATVMAADDAIAAATAAIDAADNISNSEAAMARDDVADIQTALDAAKSSRQMAMDEAERMRQEQMQAEARRTAQLTAITMAIDAATTAVNAVNDASTQAEVDAANAAVANARAKIAEGADVDANVLAGHTATVDTIAMSLSNAETSRNMAIADSEELARQRMAISDAIADARTAVAAVNDDSSDAVVDAAEEAIADARVAIAGQADVPAEEKAANNDTVGEIMAQLNTAKASRDDAIAAREKDEADRMAAMAATAAKLYAGINAPVPLADLDQATPTFTVNDMAAAYNAAETAILLSIGDGGDTAHTAVTATLSEDKKTMVAANHGWEGKRYADPAGGDSYEAVVYSNVEEPTMGRKFGSDDAGTGATRKYEYTLSAAGVLTEAEADGVGESDDAFVAARVALTGVTRTAGTETWIEDPLPPGTSAIKIPGSYHGVSGNYYCAPAVVANGCSASVAAKGFTVSGATDEWTFVPSSAEARVMEAADAAYASYGWWLYKSENGATYTASAFHDFKGTAGTVDIANLVGGSATYVGGAAGKYALASPTPGGTNDAGHFTAKATLEADFEDDVVTGTIDNFMGADGEARDWTVELNESTLATTGVISGDPDTAGNTDAQMTVWTIGDDEAAASGEWSGNLREEGTDGVPEVATGTFYSEFGTAGRMVGGFGANEQ